MNYAGMPMGMWTLFAGSFRKQLTAVFGYDAPAAKEVTKNAKPRYQKIVAGLPEFERADRFKMNIVNCAMLCAFVLSMPERPDVQRLTKYYADAMMTAPMRWFCRKSGKNKFSEKDRASMRATAALRAAEPPPLLRGGEDACGFCLLLRKVSDVTSPCSEISRRSAECGVPAFSINPYGTRNLRS